MSSRLVLALWLVAIALGGAVFAVKSRQGQQAKSTIRRAGGETLFEKFPAGEVASIVVTDADHSVRLVKQDAKWVVADRENYPANVTAVNDLLRSVEELKVVDGIEAGATYAGRFGMDETATRPEERGTSVVFGDISGKELAKLSVGKTLRGDDDATPMGAGGGASGRFVRNHADESGIYKTGEMFAALSADPKRWLAEEFVQVQKPVSIAVTQAGKPDLAWKLNRADESADFALEGLQPEEKPEASVLAPFKNLFSFARFDDVASAAEVATRADSANQRVATVTTVEGFTYTFTLTPAKPAEAKPPAAPEESPAWFLTVKVDATLPTERKQDAGEKPDDSKEKDAAFASRLKELQDKLANEKALEGRTFIVSQSAIEPLLKERPDFFKKSAPANQATTPPLMIPGMR
jgi:hypothetical protein